MRRRHLQIGLLWGSLLVPPLFLGGVAFLGFLLVEDLSRPVVIEWASKGSVLIRENGGVAQLALRIWRPERRFVMLRHFHRPVQAELAISTENVTEGRDVVSLERILTVPQSEGEGKCAIIPLDNQTVDLPRRLTLSLSRVQGAVVGQVSQVDVQLEDDERVQLRVEVPPLVEVYARQVFSVRVQVDPPCSFDTRLAFETRDGDARAGRDYEPAKAEIVLAAGESSWDFELTALEAFTQEEERQFFVVVRLLRGNQVLEEVQEPVRLTFPRRDLDFEIDAREVFVTREVTGAPVRLRLKSPSGDPIKLTLETVEGTARAGVHFQPKREEIVFAPGELIKEIFIPLVNREPDGSAVSFELVVSRGEGPKRQTKRRAVTLKYPPPPPVLRVPEELVVSPKMGERHRLPLELSLDRTPQEKCSVAVRLDLGPEIWLNPPQAVNPESGQPMAMPTRIEFQPGQEKHQLLLEVIGVSRAESERSFTVQFLDPRDLQLERTSTLVRIRPGKGMPGAVLILLPLTTSAQQNWETLRPQLERVVQDHPELLDGALWFVDFQGVLQRWRNGPQPEGLPIQDEDFEAAFNRAFVAVSQLQANVAGPLKEIIICWVSEQNPDYGDLGTTVNVPRDGNYSVIWVREELPGTVRESRRLQFWFGKQRVFVVAPGEVSHVIGQALGKGS
jgi:hypothetical protein